MAIPVSEPLDHADPYDRASAVSDMYLAIALSEARGPVQAPSATGECLFCGEPLAPGLRWCPVLPDENPEHGCMQSWAREQERKRKAGL
jgi:hypothetical protein